MDKNLERYKTILLDIINKIIPDCKVYLFGSRARKDHSEGSDIDIALDAGSKIDYKIIYKIKDELEESTIPLFVDIVDLNFADEKIKKEINRDKIIWKN